MNAQYQDDENTAHHGARKRQLVPGHVHRTSMRLRGLDASCDLTTTTTSSTSSSTRMYDVADGAHAKTCTPLVGSDETRCDDLDAAAEVTRTGVEEPTAAQQKDSPCEPEYVLTFGKHSKYRASAHITYWKAGRRATVACMPDRILLHVLPITASQHHSITAFVYVCTHLVSHRKPTSVHSDSSCIVRACVRTPSYR
jgi:hypothetical protein